MKETSRQKVVIISTTTILIFLLTLKLPQAASETIGECGLQHSCQNGGECLEDKDSHNYTCSCPSGYTGPYCTEDVNECSRRPSVCKNGATCQNKFGSYQCMCINGWAGPDCSENVNDCLNVSCENNGTCVDEIGRFRCECQPGKIGLLCQLDDACYKNPCFGNSTCDTDPVDGSAICSCPQGFTGKYCDIDLDECLNDNPCEHGGVCVNTPGSYRCDCTTGFKGPRCEINVDECQEKPCLNGGTCLDEPGKYRCVCLAGFTGSECQIDVNECDSNPCHNGAKCTDLINSFKCTCPPGFWGSRCEYSNSEMKYDYQDPGEQVSAKNPWAKCFNPLKCFREFADGVCQQECNTPECLSDGNDCVSLDPNAQCDDKTDCLRKYGDGQCDEECNTAICGWDGSDCNQVSGSMTYAPLQDYLVIRVHPAIEIGETFSPSEASKNLELSKLLRKVSVMTNTVLKVLKLSNVDNGTDIILEADNRYCKASCYKTTNLIASFLSALSNRTKKLSDEDGKTSIKMSWVTPSPGLPGESSSKDSPSTWFFIICGSLATVCVLLMVISTGNKQKVKEKAVVWFPEGFKPVLSSRNKDPTNRKSGRGVSTLQALGGNFFRGIKRNERNISTNPNGIQSTDFDSNGTATPNGIYHEPYDQYDQYGTYNGTDTGTVIHNMDSPMTPTPMPVNPINLEGPDGFTPLMVASMSTPFSKEPLGLVAYGTTGEMDGCAENNVTDLLNRGAQLNLASRETGETALHLAARHGRVDAARGLLERCDSQDVNAQDATGRTPLHAAIAADSQGVFELLIRCRGTDLNAQSNDGTTPLILAIKFNHYSMLEELINNECEVTKSDANGKTALHWAAVTNNVDAIKKLLSVRETNKDAQDLAEETPLFLAAREGAKRAVELLLSHNANKDISDQMDRSPISIARSRHHYDIVRLLEEHEPPTPRSIASVQHSSRQLSPTSVASPNGDSNSNAQTFLQCSYNVPPGLKNYTTPLPDSPFSLESMATPPNVYIDQQYHPGLVNQKQAGVYI